MTRGENLSGVLVDNFDVMKSYITNLHLDVWYWSILMIVIDDFRSDRCQKVVSVIITKSLHSSKTFWTWYMIAWDDSRKNTMILSDTRIIIQDRIDISVRDVTNHKIRKTSEIMKWKKNRRDVRQLKIYLSVNLHRSDNWWTSFNIHHDNVFLRTFRQGGIWHRETIFFPDGRFDDRNEEFVLNCNSTFCPRKFHGVDNENHWVSYIQLLDFLYHGAIEWLTFWRKFLTQERHLYFIFQTKIKINHEIVVIRYLFSSDTIDIMKCIRILKKLSITNWYFRNINRSNHHEHIRSLFRRSTKNRTRIIRLIIRSKRRIPYRCCDSDQKWCMNEWVESLKRHHWENPQYDYALLTPCQIFVFSKKWYPWYVRA